MTHKIYDITDLGPGDGGKGGVVHKVETMTRPHTIIKFGGAQGQHGVVTSRGERYAFSQWGCGTFEGIKTHISKSMVVSPVGLLNEGDALRYQQGIHDAFELLTVDERVLCATVYHGIVSRLKEMARGKNPRGTIGTGVGEAYRDSQKYPELIIRAGDLSRPDIKDRLAAVREHIRQKHHRITRNTNILSKDLVEWDKERRLLESDEFFDFSVSRLQEAAKRVKIVDSDYFRREVLAKEGVAIMESSHGVLTDHFYGFFPHVSAIRTLPCFRYEMLKEAGYDGQIVTIGVSRAYSIRHGAGPMPTDDPAMYENLLPGSHKVENRYQGRARVGPLDLVLLRYAIEVCGGPSAFDGLAITWFDQIQENRSWKVCNRYRGIGDPTYFLPSGEIRVWWDSDPRHNSKHIKHQGLLGKKLSECVSEIEAYKVSARAGRDELYSLCAEVLREKTGVPVRLVSFGPTERDKVCK